MATLTRRVRRRPGRPDRVSWWVRWRDPAGAQHNKTFERKVDAERFLHEVEHRKVVGGYVDPQAGRLRVAEWVERWWPTSSGLRASSRARDDAYLRLYVLPAFGPMPLAEVTHEQVQAWVAGLEERGLAPATVVKAHQLLAKVMAAAVDARRIVETPCRRIRLPRVEREEMRFLSPPEVAELADAIEPRYRALVLLGAYGGLRIGELAGLRRRDVDALNGAVTVVENVVEVAGRLVVNPPKTRAGHRTVSLPRSVVGEVAHHLMMYTAPDAGARVFSGVQGGPLSRTRFRARVWLPAVRAAGLEPLRPHDLRHTAVALWIAAGATPNEVAARAGHTSVSVVLDRYGHLFPEANERLRSALEAMAAGAGAKRPRASVTPLPKRAPRTDDQ